MVYLAFRTPFSVYDSFFAYFIVKELYFEEANWCCHHGFPATGSIFPLFALLLTSLFLLLFDLKKYPVTFLDSIHVVRTRAKTYSELL